MSKERTLTQLPYQRIPGVDATLAQGIVGSLKRTGVWDANGARVVADVQQAAARASTAALPAAAMVSGIRNEVTNETALQLAIHQFTAEFGLQVRAFFDAHL